MEEPCDLSRFAISQPELPDSGGASLCLKFSSHFLEGEGPPGTRGTPPSQLVKQT